VSLILNNPALFAEWQRDIKTMAHRVIDMRQRLYDLLTNKFKTPGDWSHITSQIGMFSYTGLNGECWSTGGADRAGLLPMAIFVSKIIQTLKTIVV
jgi:aspartate/tyrosine/aromatic aminotransferase